MRKLMKKILLIAVTMSIVCFTFGIIMFNLCNEPIYGAVPASFIKGEFYNARKTFDFNYDWKFSKGEGVENNGSSIADAHSVVYIPNESTTKVYANNYTEGLNNETWTSVSLPHTYNDTDTFDDYVEALNLNGEQAVNGSGQSMNGERTMYGGTAWYKKQFYIPSSYEDKQIYIEFEAARQSAQIWVNGKAISGKYLNGFIAFGYDITSALNYGGDEEYNNVITVLVDNSFPYYVTFSDNGTPNDATDDYYETMYDYEVENNGTKATTNAIPWHDSHWHPNFGGLYRNSYLHVTDKLHLTLPLYSFMETEGTYVYTSDETSANGATVNVKAQIINFKEGSDLQSFDFGIRIFNAENQLVAYNKNGSNQLTLSLNDTRYVNMTTKIPVNKLHLWSPEYPYLYKVECSIFQNGVCIDNNITEIGVRTFRATTDNGLLINENYTYLHGWGQKSTMEWAGIGAAYPNYMQEYVIKSMKDAGGNYIRFGHTAGSVTQVKIADRLGIVVTQPGVDGEGNQFGGNTYTLPGFRITYNNVTKKIRTDAFRDMIILFRNSPSIFFWELGNYGESAFDGIFQTMRDYVSLYDFAGRGNDGEATNVGPSSIAEPSNARLTTARQLTSTTIQGIVDVAETTDGSFNYVPNVTYGNSETAVRMPTIEGEFDRYEARRGVWDRKTEGFTEFSNIYAGSNTTYQYLTSESLATQLVKDYNTKLLSKGLNHLGGANWIYSDSTSHARVLSEVSRTTGEVDATMLEKESYYVSQVLYTDAPLSHIVGHWNYPANTTKTVYVVSKASSIKLTYPNGEGGYVSLTKSNSQNTTSYLYEFSNVTYNPGTISVKGYSSSGTELLQARDSITTVGEPADIKITNVFEGKTLSANGSDYLILDIELVDENNNRCLTYDGQINNSYVYFNVIGDSLGANSTCVWRGGYNSGLEDTVNNKHLYFEAGITRVAIRTTMKEGLIGVTATMGSFTKTYNINTTAISDASTIAGKNFNYTSPRELKTIDLNKRTELEYNSVVPVAPLMVEYDEYNNSSVYLKSLINSKQSFSYNVNALTSNSYVYEDLNMKYSLIPKELQNADIVVYNNSLYKEDINQLFSFTLEQDCNIFLLFPVMATVPSWVTSATDLGATVTNYYIVADNGINYRVYEKALSRDDIEGNAIVHTLGSVSTTNNRDYMYTFGFYKPVTITQGDDSQVFVPSTTGGYYDKLNTNSSPLTPKTQINYPKYETTSNYIVYDRDSNSNLSVTQATLGSRECIQLYDSLKNVETEPKILDNIAGIFVPINSGNFVFQFDFYVDNALIEKEPMKYTRLFFQNSNDYDTSDVNQNGLFRTFFDGNGSSKNTNFKTYTRWGDNANNTKQTINYNYGNLSFSTASWYTYRYTIDITSSAKKVLVEYQLKNAESWTTMFNNQNCESLTNWNTDLTSVQYALFATGGNGRGKVGIANLSVTTSSVDSRMANTLNGISFDGSATTQNNINYLTGSGSQTQQFLYTQTSYKLLNLVDVPSLNNIVVSKQTGVESKVLIDTDNKFIKVDLTKFENGIPIKTTYIFNFTIQAGITHYLKVFGNNVPLFNKETKFYYMGEYDEEDNPLPTLADLETNLGTIINTVQKTIDTDYLRRVEITIFDTSANINRDFILSYSYYSEYVLYNGKYYNYLLDRNEHQYRTIQDNYLYETNTVYLSDTYITSVPYKYSGAEFIETANDNFSSYLTGYSRYDSTLLLLVNTHDILTDILSNKTATEIISGWTYTGEIVTLSNDEVFSIFTKSISANSIFSFDYNNSAFNSYTRSPIIAIKKNSLISDSSGFFYEDFDVVDENNVPHGWELYEDVDNGTSITYDATNKMLTFVDSSTNSGTTDGKYAYINRNFSNMFNKFELTVKMIVYDDSTTTHLNDNVKYIRIWLLDEDLTKYSGDGSKEHVGVECYLHDYSTTGMALMYRQVDDNNSESQLPIYQSIPKGKWLTIKFTVDPQKHNYKVQVSYDETVRNNNTSYNMLYDTVNKVKVYRTNMINNLVFGTAANGTNYFSVKEMKIESINTDTIANININDVPINSFTELTPNYMYVANITEELPTISVTKSGYASSENPTIVMDDSGAYYIITVTDQENETHTHRVYLYADNRPLQELVQEASQIFNSTQMYTSSTWSQFVNAYDYSSGLINGFSHNFMQNATAYSDLSNAMNNLIEIYLITLNYENTQTSVSVGDTNYFEEGSVVTIRITPKLNYSIDSVSATSESGEDLTIIMSRFTMPAENVTVDVVMGLLKNNIIILGTYYSNFVSNATQIDITENSTMTMAYSQRLNLENYTDLHIFLNSKSSWTIPTGTKITMVDASNQEDIAVYYYICQTDISSIELTSFVKMGTLNVNYVYPTGVSNLVQSLLFIVNFEDVENLTTGGFVLNYDDGLNDLYSLELDFNVAVDNTTDLSASYNVAPVYQNDKFTMNVQIDKNTTTNSKTLEEELTLVVSNLDNSPFNFGTKITLLGKEIYYSNDLRKIAIPILNAGDYLIEFDTLISMLDVSGTFKLELYTSNKAGYWENGALQKTTTISYENLVVAPSCALDIQVDDADRVIEANNYFEATLVYNNEIANAQSVTVEIEKKVNDYVQDTTLLQKIIVNETELLPTNGKIEIKNQLSGSSKFISVYLETPEKTTTFRIKVTILKPNGEETFVYLQMIYKI